MQPTAALAITSVAGRGIPVRGADIDTDRIIPARFLREITFDNLGPHAFEDERKAAGGAHPFDDPRFRGARVLVVNRNFGCGSSREHAPQALHRWGIDAILGESFGEIFFGNCVAIGIPCLTLAPSEIDALQAAIESDPSLELQVDVKAATVRVGDAEYSASIPSGAQRSFLTGDWDALGMLLANPDEVKATRARLPYVNGFER